MKRMSILREMVAVLSMAVSGVLAAQSTVASVQPDSPVATVSNSTPWEYGALVQGGNGLQDRTDFHFLMVGAHLGKVLTPDFGTGMFKGNLEYAVEVLPFWQSYTPKFQRISCSGPVPVDSARPAVTEGCSAPYSSPYEDAGTGRRGMSTVSVAFDPGRGLASGAWRALLKSED